MPFIKPQNLFNYYYFTNPLTNPIISNIFEIVSNLDFTEGEVKNLKKEKDNYFIENSFYIFKYFEEKKKISYYFMVL